MSESSVLWVVGGVVGLLVAVFAVRLARAYLRNRGERLVTCPENEKTAVVEVDAWRAAFSSAAARPELRLTSCSRWPDKAGCGQLCLDEIEAAPDGCLVRSTVADWYRGKSCVVCGREFGEIHQLDHQPALMTPDRRTVLWRDIAAERLDDVLATHGPVCWNCHVAETFRREHPDLVVDRPAHDAHYSGRS